MLTRKPKQLRPVHAPTPVSLSPFLSLFPTPCGPQKAAPRCAREIYLTAAASLSPFLLFDAALDEMAAAVAVAVADTPWAWAGCKATWRWYKIKFQLLTNIYALPDKSGIKLWRRAAQTAQSAKCKVQSAE